MRYLRLMVFCSFVVQGIGTTFAQFDHQLKVIRPLIEAQIKPPKKPVASTIESRKQDKINGVTLHRLGEGYEIDEEIRGRWKEYTQAFPAEPAAKSVPNKYRDQVLRIMQHYDADTRVNNEIRLGFHKGDLAYAHWSEVPWETFVPYNVVTNSTPDYVSGSFSRLNVGFIDKHPSPYFPMMIARMRGRFSTWSNPWWQYALFPAYGKIEHVIVDAFLGTKGNVSYYEANVYSYYKEQTYNRIVAIPPEADCYWITELHVTRRSDKTGAEVDAKNAFLMTPEAFWRMIFSELYNEHDHLRLDSVKNDPSRSTYARGMGTSTPVTYEQLTSASSKRIAVAVFAALEHPKIDISLLKDFGRDGKKGLNQFDPDEFSADVAYVLTTAKTSAATRLRVLDLLTWWNSKRAVPNLIRLLELKAIAKTKIADAELMPLREATARTLTALTDENFGQDAAAWRQWLGKASK